VARRNCRDEAGFTLVEVMVGLVLFGLLSTISVGAFRKYDQANAHEGSAQALASQLRNTQLRATSEGRSYCVRIGADNRSWTVWRTACGTGTQVSSGRTRSAQVTLPAAGRSFTDRAGVTSTTDISFYRSGMASAGQMTVARTSGTKVYTIKVEGLTARVALS
jgi:prepilin-type N-terminal cleavage/methylation domain-containing protein